MMMMMSVLLPLGLLVLGASVGNCQKSPFPIQSFPGPCPEIAVDNGFDLKKMTQGVWYQVYASDEVHWNSSLKCIERRYSASDSSLAIQKYYILHRRPVWTDSSLDITNKSGVFLHPAPKGQNGTETPWYHRVEIRVISSEPDSHVVMWGCLYDKRNDKHYESAGISSRERSLEAKKFEDLKSMLGANGAGIRFDAVDWTDCRARCE